jgi:hypothetical protein
MSKLFLVALCALVVCQLALANSVGGGASGKDEKSQNIDLSK